jgi:tetratricopeptide (TPR) repeat protein
LAIDRADALRKAEKFLRQGKLDPAIAEYLRVVEEQPRDWNARNTLGDLYARAGHTDKAVEQFIRIADSLNEEGFTSKAAALYKKVLKLKPDEEHALLQGAEISAAQGILADARMYLNAVAERRRKNKDTRGVAQIQIRLGSLDPNDFEARRVAANARVQIGDEAGAVDEFTQMAADLTDKGRASDAIEALRQAAALQPDNTAIRAQLLDAYVAGGDFARARECATTADQFRALAQAFEAKGHADESVEALRDAARLAPDDGELRAQLARTFVGRGDLHAAAEYLTEESAGGDPELLLTIAEMRLRGDQMDAGLALIRQLLEQDASRREQIAMLGWTIAEKSPEAGFNTIELAADSAVVASDWASAAAALQEFVTRVPNHIPALMHLVEICVDGGLEATMYSAQAQLADAYIAVGAASEARFISEDLVAREPWEKSNIERFRRALVLLGEPDPDALIASRLSGESPFTSTDMSSSDDAALFEAPLPAAEAAAEAAAAAQVEDLLAAVAEAEAPSRKSARQPRRRQEEEHHFELSANAIDLESILGEFEAAAQPMNAEPEEAEVDLSVVLGDINPTAPSPPAAPTDDLDGVFGNLRDQASKRTGLNEAEKEYKRGLALRAAGDIDGCIRALEQASRAPKLRFATAWLIARLYRDRGMVPDTLEWLERAAQAPAHTSDDAHQVLYELAEALESSGELERALAICLELQAEAGDYSDVGARIDRLSKAQTRG